MIVRLGLLSTARINDEIIGAAQESDRVEVLAVASRDDRRAEAYAREKGIERSYGSYEGLLGDPDVDAVYISLPNGMHIPWTMHSLQAGKHVLCEKPLSRRADDVVRAFELAESAGLVLSEGFMWRATIRRRGRSPSYCSKERSGGSVSFAPPSASSSRAGTARATPASTPSWTVER